MIYMVDGVSIYVKGVNWVVAVRSMYSSHTDMATGRGDSNSPRGTYIAGMATKGRRATMTTVATVNGGGDGNMCEMREVGILIERGARLLYIVCKSPSVQWCVN